MNGQHTYNLRVEWTGNRGVGTSNYKVYERSHTIIVDNKPDILASADPAFRGDKTKHNPEDLLVASLSACHMLSYLHLCAVSGVIVTDYIDNATGIMIETPDRWRTFFRSYFKSNCNRIRKLNDRKGKRTA